MVLLVNPVDVRDTLSVCMRRNLKSPFDDFVIIDLRCRVAPKNGRCNQITAAKPGLPSCAADSCKMLLSVDVTKDLDRKFDYFAGDASSEIVPALSPAAFAVMVMLPELAVDLTTAKHLPATVKRWGV